MNQAENVIDQADKTEDGKSTKKDKSKVFAGDLNLIDDPVTKKRKEAQQKALKVVKDAWDIDRSIDADIQERRDHYDKMKTLYSEAQDEVLKINDQKKALREQHMVEPDSQEQKDLELLEKYQNNRAGVSDDSFSKEEIERLRELQNIPLTDYQKEVLKLNSTACEISGVIEEKENSFVGDTMAITDSEIERLKSQDMIKASAAAEDIMDAAGKDIIGMLVEESKEHVDDKLEEEQKKAEEAKQKEEEQQELVDKAKERKEEAEQQAEAISEAKDSQEEVLDGVGKADSIELESNIKKKSVDHVEEAQKQINKILKDNNLVNDDLKGIEIDLNF